MSLWTSLENMSTCKWTHLSACKTLQHCHCDRSMWFIYDRNWKRQGFFALLTPDIERSLVQHYFTLISYASLVKASKMNLSFISFVYAVHSDAASQRSFIIGTIIGPLQRGMIIHLLSWSRKMTFQPVSPISAAKNLPTKRISTMFWWIIEHSKLFTTKPIGRCIGL